MHSVSSRPAHSSIPASQRPSTSLLMSASLRIVIPSVQRISHSRTELLRQRYPPRPACWMGQRAPRVQPIGRRSCGCGTGCLMHRWPRTIRSSVAAGGGFSSCTVAAAWMAGASPGLPLDDRRDHARSFMCCRRYRFWNLRIVQYVDVLGLGRRCHSQRRSSGPGLPGIVGLASASPQLGLK